MSEDASTCVRFDLKRIIQYRYSAGSSLGSSNRLYEESKPSDVLAQFRPHSNRFPGRSHATGHRPEAMHFLSDSRDETLLLRCERPHLVTQPNQLPVHVKPSLSIFFSKISSHLTGFRPCLVSLVKF